MFSWQLKMATQSIEPNFLINFFPKRVKAKIPTSIIIFLLLTQMCFGANCKLEDHFEGKTRKTVLTVTSLMSAIILFLLIMPIMYVYNEVWFWCSFTKNAIHILILNFTSYNIFHFIRDIHQLRKQFPSIAGNTIGVVMLLYTMTMFFAKGTLSTIRCTLGQSKFCSDYSVKVYIIYVYSCLGSDAVSGIIIVIMYYIYALVKHMKHSFKRDKDLVMFEKRYIKLAKYFDKIKPLVERMIVVELLINTPRLMETLWSMLVYIKENAEWYSYTSEWMFAFHLAIQMCIPAVIAEMVNCQMDAIKLMLNEQRRIERDSEKSSELTRILRYIKARRLQNEIWRVVPVDLRLPLALISCCTTYFIVILQFTHLYD